MKNSFGSNFTVTIFGESHGPAIGAVLDGLPAGIAIDFDQLQKDMAKRQARGELATARQEPDQVEILSGLFNGCTTGTPLTLVIQNTNTHSHDYTALKSRLRPGHADFTAYAKYKGYQDYRGGGHFSGRITAGLVAAGSLCRQILKEKGIEIASHIEQLHTVQDTPFSLDPVLLKSQMRDADEKLFAVLDEEKGRLMQETILEAKGNLDSVGGILETAITGMPAGVGEPFFDSVESILAHLLFSIPAVKGVSFGAGFGFARMYGHEANDPFVLKDGQIVTATNHNGGLNGGITNGMPILVHTVIKPTPSIYQPQQSVDYAAKEEVILEIKGRHDPCIIHRARAVVDCALAIGLLDLLISSRIMETAS